MNKNLKNALSYLQEHELKLVTAESCTAGLVASMLAEEPGSACWLECAFITYSPQAKISCLAVKQETIDQYNLTSEEVAREMAEGALRISRANAALANTGLAGPGGDNTIPVGTVCFAWSFQEGSDVVTFSETCRFDGDRNQVRKRAAEYAIGRVWHYHNAFTQSGAPPAPNA